MNQRSALIGFVVASLLSFQSVSYADSTVSWDGSGGLLPDQSTPVWILFDDATPEDPVLSAGVLSLSTDVESENVYYTQSGAEISINDPVVVEFRARVTASSASVPSKAAVSVALTVSSDFGNSLQIGVDEIFVLIGNNMKGPSAVVDTNGAFHTYRIEADLAGNFDVYYDDVLTLSGDSFTSAATNGPTPRVLWGLVSSFSTGTAEFESFAHNAGPPAVPALGTPGLAIFVAAVLATTTLIGRARRRG
jgi:hypothetical protein